MSHKNNGFSSYVYFPLILTFIFLLGCFAVALMTIRDDAPQNYTIANVSPFDLASGEKVYTYVESQEKDGIKYFVIDDPNIKQQPDKSAVSSTAPSVPDEINSVKPNSKEKIVYLTFDDGPSENTEKILDILDRYNVKATFFVIYHKNMEKQYKKIVEKGHTIALHSYSHNYKKIYSSESAYFSDLKKIGDYVKSVTGVDSHITRFPGGSSNTISNKYKKGIMKNLKKDVLSKGYIYHDWNVDSKDASKNNVPANKLLENIKSSLNQHRQANILMHDTGKMKQTTVEALPKIIEYVQSQGYKIEPITEESVPIRHNW